MLTLLSTSLGFSADPLGALKTALQQELDLLSSVHPSFALNLGWTSAEGSFGLAAGNVNVPGQPPRAALPVDRYLFGSGTKPVTATAVLRLRTAGASASMHGCTTTSARVSLCRRVTRRRMRPRLPRPRRATLRCDL